MFGAIFGNPGGDPLQFLRAVGVDPLGRQIVSLVVILVGSWVLQPLLRRGTEKYAERKPDARRVPYVIAIAQRGLVPLCVWASGRVVMFAYHRLGWQTDVLGRIVGVFGVWALYRLVAVVLCHHLPPKSARFWTRTVLMPVFLVIAALAVWGRLDTVRQVPVLSNPSMMLTVGSVTAGIAIFLISLFLARVLRPFLEKKALPKAGFTPDLACTLAKVVSNSVWILGLLAALTVMGVDLGVFAVLGGGLSVGLGFGMREVVSNFVSGFILMCERSITAGDVVEVEGIMSVVQHVGIRSTTVKSLDNIEIIIPNSTFLTDRVTNYTRADQLVRIHVDVGVSYESDPMAVVEILLRAGNYPGVLPEPAPKVWFLGFGDSSIDFELLVWTDDAKGIPQLESNLRHSIWEALKSRGITIPFPQRDVHIRSTVAGGGGGSFTPMR